MGMGMAMAMARGRITLRLQLLLLLFSATRTCLAQQSNGTRHQSSTAGGFTPTTVVVLVVLIFAFVVLTLFSIYINRCAQVRAPPRRGFRTAPETVDVSSAHSDRRRSPGLDRELVEAFPTALYGDVKARMAAKSGPLECAVCLSEFADSDELRVLPTCRHVFHPGCIDPWLAGAITCPLCRADLTGAPAPPATDSCDLTAPAESEELDVACLVGSFTPESAISFGPSHDILGAGNYYYRRTQSAMEAPDRHTLRLPDHVMKELAAVRRHRRAASLAGYPDAVERTPRWLSSLWRSVSWQRQSRVDTDAGEEHGGSKRVFPVAGASGERPSGSGSRGDEKEKSDTDPLNSV